MPGVRVRVRVQAQDGQAMTRRNPLILAEACQATCMVGTYRAVLWPVLWVIAVVIYRSDGNVTPGAGGEGGTADYYVSCAIE